MGCARGALITITPVTPGAEPAERPIPQQWPWRLVMPARCVNSKWNQHTKCNPCQETRLAPDSEPRRPRRTTSGVPVAVDTPELATIERRVLPVPYALAPRRMAPRQCAYREERERPRKRPKIAHQPEPEDRVVPYPKSQTHRVEPPHPHPPTTGTPRRHPENAQPERSD